MKASPPPTLAESLVGRTIQRVVVQEEGQRLTFLTDKGRVSWVCKADCCSYTWMETVEVEPGLVLEVEEVEGTDEPLEGREPSKGDYDYVRYHAVKVKTTGGHGLIDFRNDSNGHYDGSMKVDFVENLGSDLKLP